MSDGQSEKTFVVEQPRKTFRIEGETSLTPIPGTNREIMFATQRNSYDCGPCIALNTLQVLGVDSGLSSVIDMRLYANQLRSEVAEPTLPDNGWFKNTDVDRVLLKQGLNVTSWLATTDEYRRELKDYIEELARKKQEFVIYTGTGRHYKGLYRNGENGVFELDSLRQAIPRVGTDAIEAMINRASRSDRVENLSVASQPRFQILR